MSFADTMLAALIMILFFVGTAFFGAITLEKLRDHKPFKWFAAFSGFLLGVAFFFMMFLLEAVIK